MFFIVQFRGLWIIQCVKYSMSNSYYQKLNDALLSYFYFMISALKRNSKKGCAQTIKSWIVNKIQTWNSKLPATYKGTWPFNDHLN